MQDYQVHLETLRRQAAESALIRDLATAPHKRQLFTLLATHLQTLAYEVECAMAAAKDQARPKQTAE